MLIGLIGVGKMGRAICERLMETGNQLVVWNRSPEKIADLKGVTIASTPAEVAASAEIIISVLANDHATQSVYFEEGGLTSISLQGKLIIEICTSSPERAVELEKAVMDAVNNLSKNITIILIAHRINTLKKCDIIFEFEKGELVNQFSYNDLKQSNFSGSIENKKK